MPDRRPLGRAGRDARQRPGQGVVLCLRMLRVAVVASHLGLMTAVGLGLAWAGLPGGVCAAAAGALVIAFFASGQAVQLVASQMANGMGLALVLGSYLVRVTGAGLVLWLATRHSGHLAAVMVRPAFILGAALAALGWLAGVLWTGARQRVFVYDGQFEQERESRGSGL